MKGRIRFCFDGHARDQKRKSDARKEALTLLKRLKVLAKTKQHGRVGVHPDDHMLMLSGSGFDTNDRNLFEQVTMVLEDQVARIHFTMEHPEASLQFVESEGFKFLNDDDEMLFRIAIGGAA